MGVAVEQAEREGVRRGEMDGRDETLGCVDIVPDPPEADGEAEIERV